MPICHITLRNDHPEAYLDALSEGLHQTLVACFDVPPEDCFQVFHTLPTTALRYNPHYLTGQRSDNWTLIEITAGKPRSTAIKRAFYARLAQRLSIQPGLHPDELMVVIRHNQAEDWSFGGGLASMLKLGE
jgi:phenylpyruvate tautomerase PptA (4-oxalocrotonate tautomerase family)